MGVPFSVACYMHVNGLQKYLTRGIIIKHSFKIHQAFSHEKKSEQDRVKERLERERKMLMKADWYQILLHE